MPMCGPKVICFPYHLFVQHLFGDSTRDWPFQKDLLKETQISFEFLLIAAFGGTNDLFDPIGSVPYCR